MASCVKSVHVGFSQIEDPKVLERTASNYHWFQILIYLSPNILILYFDNNI